MKGLRIVPHATFSLEKQLVREARILWPTQMPEISASCVCVVARAFNGSLLGRDCKGVRYSKHIGVGHCN